MNKIAWQAIYHATLLSVLLSSRQTHHVHKLKEILNVDNTSQKPITKVTDINVRNSNDTKTVNHDSSLGTTFRIQTRPKFNQIVHLFPALPDILLILQKKQLSQNCFTDFSNELPNQLYTG